jgi:hypothetical protein
MPNEPVNGNISIDRSRHVRIIGGKLNGSITNRRSRGSLFLEGLEINPGASRDAIVLTGESDNNTPSTWTRPDLYVQNTRVTGISGSYSGFHADVIQKQGPMGGMFVDKFTAETDYQGFFIASQSFSSSLASPAAQAFVDGMDATEIQRTNIRTPGGITAKAPLLWLAWHAGTNAAFPTEDPWPIKLHDVYVKGQATQSLGSMIFPKPGAVGNNGAQVGFQAASDGLSGGWPAASMIAGTLRKGDPPSGDFAPAGIGTGYQSPGYQ